MRTRAWAFVEGRYVPSENLVLCDCGKPAHPLYGKKCEDCWVDGVLNPFSDASEKAESQESENQESSPLLMTIAELGLPARALNSLENADIETVSDLIENTKEQILEIRHLGAGTLKSITDQLAELGLKLRGE